MLVCISWVSKSTGGCFLTSSYVLRSFASHMCHFSKSAEKMFPPSMTQKLFFWRTVESRRKHVPPALPTAGNVRKQHQGEFSIFNSAILVCFGVVRVAYVPFFKIRPERCLPLTDGQKLFFRRRVDSRKKHVPPGLPSAGNVRKQNGGCFLHPYPSYNR